MINDRVLDCKDKAIGLLQGLLLQPMFFKVLNNELEEWVLIQITDVVQQTLGI